MAEERSRGAVVITGASTGIGRACALWLDRMGFGVFAGVRRDMDGQSLREAASARLTPLIIDVTEERSIEQAASAVTAAVGDEGLAGLVNNAGIAVAGPLEFLPLERLRGQLEVNVIGQVAVTQAFLPLLRRRRGRIVFMGSISGRLAGPFLGPYAASKFALEALTDSLRVELRPWDMHVAIVEPGSIDTPIWAKGLEAADALEQELPEAALALYRPYIDALRTAVEQTAAAGIPPDEVAKAVAHALMARRPKTRYLVGRDARMLALIARWVPDRLRDRLVRRRFAPPS